MDRQTRPNELNTAPRKPVTRSSLASDLRALGLVEGATDAQRAGFSCG